MGLLSSKNSKVKQAQILLLGLDSAGKSTLLYKLKLAEDTVTLPTVGFNVEMIELEKSLSLTVWDVGGQKKMRSVWGCYCERTDGLVYVVDSADKQRLPDSRREFERILKNEHIKNVPVVLFANKQDVPGALTAEDITRVFRVKKLCCDRSCKQGVVAIGRLHEKCDGECVICGSGVCACEESDYGSSQGRGVIRGGPGVSDAYDCKEFAIEMAAQRLSIWEL